MLIHASVNSWQYMQGKTSDKRRSTDFTALNKWYLIHNSGRNERMCQLMWKSKLICMVLAVIFLLAPSSAFATWYGPFCELDTDGQWKPPTYTCYEDKLVSHTLTADKHSYRFRRKCDVSQGEHAYVSYIITESEWKPDGKIVQKTWMELHPNFSVTVEAYSKVDPWAYGADCTVSNFWFAVPSSGYYEEERAVYHNLLAEYTKAPYIRTVNLTASECYQLQYELSQMPMQPPSEIPTILTPDKDKTFFLGLVPVKIKYTPAWGLSWTVQYRKDSSQPWQNVALTALLKNPSTSDGVMSGNFNYDKPGDWRFKVASGYPGSPSTAWRTITILPVPKRGPLDINK